MNTHKTELIQASIKLATRADSTAWQAKFQAHAEVAEALLRRSYRQGKAAIRLLKWAGVAT